MAFELWGLLTLLLLVIFPQIGTCTLHEGTNSKWFDCIDLIITYQCCNLSRALDWVYTVGVEKEDQFTNYICIGPVNKMINMLCVWSRKGPDSDEFRYTNTFVLLHFSHYFFSFNKIIYKSWVAFVQKPRESTAGLSMDGKGWNEDAGNKWLTTVGLCFHGKSFVCWDFSHAGES